MEKTGKKEQLDFSLKLLFKTSLFIFVALALSKIFSYIYRILIARYFGAEVYGLFSLALIVIGTFIAIFSFGFTEGILRFFSFYRGKGEINKIKYLFRKSAVILVFSSIAALILSFFLSGIISIRIFHDPNLIIFLRIFSFMIPFWIFAIYFSTIMRSFEKVKQQTSFDFIIQNFVKVFSLAIFIIAGIGSNAVIFSFFLGIATLFFLSFFYSRYKIPEIFKKSTLDINEKKQITNKFLSYSLPVMFFGIIYGLFYWIDSLSLGFFKTATEVGLYNAVVPIALLLMIAPELFIMLLFPLITKEYSRKNFPLIKELTKQIGKWIFMINLPFFLLIIIFPEAILNTLFGPEYIVGATALRFLSIGALISSLFILSNNLIAMAGKSKVLLVNMIFVTILNIFLNALLVPKPFILGLENSSGLTGASIATLISMAIFNIILMIQARRYTKVVPLRRKMILILLIAVFPLIVLLFLRSLVEITPLSIIFLVSIFYMLYVLSLLFFRGLDRNDLMIWESIKNKLKVIIESKV